MTAGAEDEWLVVGGKGKPRKPTQQQQQQHTQQPQPLQQLQQQQQAPLAGILAAVPANGSAAAVAAAAGPLPGWDQALTSPGFTYSSSSSSSSSSSRKGSRRQQQQQQQCGSSMEQQVSRLQQQVQDIARELRQAAVYQALTAAMQQAARGAAAEGQGLLPHHQHQHHQRQQQEQQEHHQQQHEQQEQQQHEQQHQQQQEQQHAQQEQQQQQQWEWPCVQQLVVYGLGSIEDSKVSRHQLALVLLLQELLPGLAQPPQLYDPAFTALDCRLLQQMGLGVIPNNEEGRRSIEGETTLFFLPHCEGVLCDNLLGANWSPTDLPRLAILGNSFATYAERWSGPPGLRPSTTRPDRLLALVQAGVVRELPVPDHRYPVASAFNDMSLHTFTAAAAAVSTALFSQQGTQ